MTRADAEGWIEISREREVATAQERARDFLTQKGINPSALSPEVLRLDVGLDENRDSYYRVRVHKPALN